MSDDFNNKIKRKLGSDDDGTGRSVSSVRRIELITDTGRRRRWSSDDKARIVVESRSRGPVAQPPAGNREGVTRDRFSLTETERRFLFRSGKTCKAPSRFEKSAKYTK